MSYASLLKNIPEFLSQPTGIAAIASLGIHGAIAFILPIMPIDSNKPKQQVASSKTVGLVELNQDEQNRLPQTSPHKVALQPLPLQSQIPPLPNFAAQQQPIPPLPPPGSTTQLILPPLPKSPTNLSISSLPKGQSLRIIPKQDFQVNPINSSLNSRAIAAQPLPRVQDQVRLGESQPLPPSHLPEIQADNTPAALPPSSLAVQPVRTSTELPPSSLAVQPVRTPALPPSNLPQLQAAKLPVDLQSVPSPTASGTTSTATAYRSITPATTVNGSIVSKDFQNQQLVTPIGAAAQTRDRLGLAGSNVLRSQLQPNTKIPVPLTSRDSGIAKTTTFGEQFNQVKQQYPNLETKLPISGTINAKAGQEGRVEGALLVNGEGKVESLNFLNNSVSSDQRTATREYIREYFQNNPAQANGKPKYYPFSLSFRTNSSSPEALKETFPRSPQVGQTTNTDASSLVNQKQISSQLRQRLIQRLRVSPVGTQPSNEQPASLSERLRPSQVNAQPLQQRQVSRSSPQVPAKPLPEQQVRNSQPTPTTETTVKPASTSNPKVSSNQPSTSIESGQKLLRRLRELREQRQNSHQEQ